LTLAEEDDFVECDFSGLCVLLVEDEEIMRLSLEDRLRLAGIPVKAACDIADAQSQLEKGDVDLVVTDVRLPDGSGAELFEVIFFVIVPHTVNALLSCHFVYAC